MSGSKGKSGRKATPTPILRLRNTYRPGRHAARVDGKLDQKRPACPQRFIRRQKNEDAELCRKSAKQVWDRLCKPLHEAGLLVDSYFQCFEMLCDSWGRYRLACEKCDAEGMTAPGSKRNDVKSPWLRIRNEMGDQVTKLAASFGLTPADVAGVRAVEKPTAEDDKRKFFTNTRA